MTEEQWDTLDNFEQIGRLVILQRVVGVNERIRTQRWVLIVPLGVCVSILELTDTYGGSSPFHNNLSHIGGVVVYEPVDTTGVTSCLNGWKYEGPWVAELEAISNARLKENEEMLLKQAQAQRIEQAKQRARDLTLLANYVSYNS
jgi:hypothetical protein